MPHALPRVIEFSRAYDVKIERLDDGQTRVVARINPLKQRQRYTRFNDLPFVAYDGTLPGYRHWSFEASDDRAEQVERGRFFWSEFARYVSAPAKRREDQQWHIAATIRDLLSRREAIIEGWTFIDCLAAHLAQSLRSQQPASAAQPKARKAVAA